MAAPHKTPRALRVLNGAGNGRDSGNRKIEPEVPFERVAPDPPKWLSGEARAEWDRVTPSLVRLGVLKAEDRAVLTAYCEVWATFVDATLELQRAGLFENGPESMRAQQSSSKELRALAAQLGLTPSSEAAVASRTKPVDDGDASAFA